MNTPNAQIHRFAKYYKRPDTVRAALINTFGHAPSIERVASIMAGAPVGPRERAPEEPKESDGIDFAPRELGWNHIINGVVPRRPKEPEEVEPFDHGKVVMMPLSQRLAHEVCHELELDRDKLFSKNRTKPYVHARALIAVLLREKGGQAYSYPQIARMLGRTDHSSVINWVRNFFLVYCRQDDRLWPLYKQLGGKREEL